VIGQRLTLARVYLCREPVDFRKGTHFLAVLVERGLGLDLFGETLLDVAITAAPSSTKDEYKARDRGMYQSRKGRQYAFGAKAHLGADADCGPVPTVTAAAVNVADIAETAHPLHRQETEVYPDAGYVGAHKRGERKGRKVQ
jgi:IS5 family transposase